MSDPIVTLTMCAELPNLDTDERTLPGTLRERGLELGISVQNDPNVDWSQAGTVIVRSVRDYVAQREGFRAWTRSIPRILSQAQVMDWGSDRHYLRELEARGLPTIPTVWLEPEQNLTKHQSYTRFPAYGDFVVEPAISSGGHGTGRYTAIDPNSRGEAIRHAMSELENGRPVMMQCYPDQIDRSGETSLICLNELASYQVEEGPMLHSSFRSAEEFREEAVRSNAANSQEWRQDEQIRETVHGCIADTCDHDELLLYNRTDIVRGDPKDAHEFHVLEVSLIDGPLYLSQSPTHLKKFADAIAMRVHW